MTASYHIAFANHVKEPIPPFKNHLSCGYFCQEENRLFYPAKECGRGRRQYFAGKPTSRSNYQRINLQIERLRDTIVLYAHAVGLINMIKTQRICVGLDFNEELGA